MSEDPKFRTVWAPDSFPYSTEAAVAYVPVTLHGTLIGYLWAAAADDAAGFVSREDVDPDAFNAAVAWEDRFRWAKANGLRPLQVLTQWAGQPEDARMGYVPADSQYSAASLDHLRAISRQPSAQ